MNQEPHKRQVLKPQKIISARTFISSNSTSDSFIVLNSLFHKGKDIAFASDGLKIHNCSFCYWHLQLCCVVYSAKSCILHLFLI